jgi:uncharacterized membrane protein YfcA
VSVLLIVGLVAAGCVTGTLAGLLGVGGGVLMVPLLTLALGRSQHVAEATSLLVILPTAVAATVVLARRGVGNLRTGFTIGIFGAAGSVGGSIAALHLPGEALRIVFAAFMVVVALRLIREVRSDLRDGHEP